MGACTGGPVSFRPMRDEDLPMLQEWMSRAHVRRWWVGDDADLGKGLGTRMVAAFVELLFRDPTVTRMQTDPDPTNRRAIRCYEKAGFRAVGEITTPDGAALYMVRDR